MIPLLGNVVEFKISSLRNKHPRSSKIDCIQGLGLCSPTVAAEEELVKRSERSGSSRSRTPTNSPSNRTPRRRSSSKKDQSYDPSTGIHTSGTAIRQRSAVQRRTPPRKLEVENPNGFRIRTSSNPGSNVEQLATRERGGALGTCVSLSPPLWLTLYRCPRGLGRSSRRFGSPTWTPKPSKASHTFPPETCLMGSLNSHLE